MKDLKALLATVAGLFVAGSMAFAAEPRIEASVDIQPTARLSADEKVSLSVAAGQILNHVNKAREALSDNNRTFAQQNVNKAITLAETIQTAIPDVKVSTEIKTEKKDYKHTEMVKPLVVPVYEELNLLTLFEPVKRARKEEKIRKGGLVSDVDVLVSRALLDVGYSQKMLKRAKLSLDQGNPKVASGYLGDIQSNVILEQVAADFPLNEAQTNMLLAKGALEDKRYDAARSYLEKASDALERFARSAGENTQKAVGDMRAEIKSMANNLAQKDEVAREKITTWWDNLSGWFQQKSPWVARQK